MIDFVRYRFISAGVSLLLIFISIGYGIYNKYVTGEVFKYSVDFTGGAQVLLHFDKPVGVSAVKEILDKSGWEGAVIREFGNNELLIRVKLEDATKNIGYVAEHIKSSIQEKIADVQVTIKKSESVGPGVGAALRTNSIWAVLLALILMLMYIAFRFWSFGFALGAVIALFHDAILVLATFLFLSREMSINVIGAVLTVLGYSVNDTIVIFARIRQNLVKMSHESLSHIVNVSINHTLRRTILTSAATGLTVLAMLLLGGESLRDFSIALTVGIIVGTYSSIYIASPIMMLFHSSKKA